MAVIHKPEPDAIRDAAHNSRFHAMCRDLAKQVEWAGGKLDEEEWKRLWLAALFGQKVVPNPATGIGFVVMDNKKSRTCTNAQMENLIGEMEAFGAERGVDWSEDDSE